MALFLFFVKLKKTLNKGKKWPKMAIFHVLAVFREAESRGSKK